MHSHRLRRKPYTACTSSCVKEKGYGIVIATLLMGDTTKGSAMHAMPRRLRPAHLSPMTEVREAARTRALMVTATLTGIVTVTTAAAGLVAVAL